MEWKTEQMERQMGDWDREQGTMDKLTNNTQKAIDELTLVSVVTCLKEFLFTFMNDWIHVIKILTLYLNVIIL